MSHCQDGENILNNIYEGYIEDSYSNIVNIFGQNGNSYINMLNGEIVFSLPKNSKLSEIYIADCPTVENSEETIFFGKINYVSGTRLCNALFEMNCKSGQINRVNRDDTHKAVILYCND